MSKGITIIVEGPIMSGKTKLIKKLADFLLEEENSVIHISEMSSSEAILKLKEKFDYILKERTTLIEQKTDL